MVNRVYAPNEFRVLMGPDDHSRFSQMEAGLQREFSELVIEEAKEHRWNLMGLPRITFESIDPELWAAMEPIYTAILAHPFVRGLTDGSLDEVLPGEYAMIADTVRVEQRGIAFGFHRAMDHAGAVIGPIIGYLLVIIFVANAKSPTTAEFSKIFLAASVPALLAVLVAIFFMRESPVPSRRGPEIAKLSLRGFDSNFKRFLLVLALFTLSNSSDSFLILRAMDSGVSIAVVPLLWAAHHGMKVLSSLFGGDLSDRLGRKQLIVSGWILYAAVYAGFAYATNQASLWVLFLVYGIYFGLAEGAEKALVADLVRDLHRRHLRCGGGDRSRSWPQRPDGCRSLHPSVGDRRDTSRVREASAFQ